MSDFHSIGSFAKVRRGASPRPINNPDFFGGTVGWVRISDVTQRNNKYLKETQQYLSPLGESCSLRVDAGDLIMSICATVGKPMIVDIPACIHDGFVQIYDINNADVEYLYYLLQFHEKDFEKRGQPGTQVNLNTTIVENEVVFLPRFKQQQKIATILSTVDNLIEKTQSLIDKYTAVKQGMMADLFTRGIDLTPGDNYGQLRPSVTEAPELYQLSELGWVPKDWNVNFLDNLSTRGSGHTPSKSFSEYWDGGIKWVSLADSSKLDNLYIYETDKNISELGIRNSSANKLPKGTVILSRDAGIGKSAILAEEMTVSQHFMAWRCGKDLNNYFLYFLLQHKKPEFNAIAMGSTIPTIGLDYFKRLRIAAPVNIEEQDKIGQIILENFVYIQRLKEEKRKYEITKKGLMQDLLTGKVKV